MNDDIVLALKKFRPRPADAWMFQDKDAWLALMEQARLFPALALPSVASPTAICGIVHSHGNGQMWMVTGEGFELTARVVLAQQRELCRALYKALKLKRLDMLIEASRHEAAGWARHLGFDFEAGPLKRIGPRGEDMNIYLYNPNGFNPIKPKQKGDFTA